MEYFRIVLLLLPIFWSCKSESISGKDPTPGTITTLPAFPSAYVDSRPISIWLPSSYDSTKRYAVLYMQDGQMLFDSTVTWTRQEWKVDETMMTLLHEHKIRDAIVVGIHNNQQWRASEYFPQAIVDSIPPEYRDHLVKGWLQNKPQADNYIKFLILELKPYIDSVYSTIPESSGTFVVGSSMGGLISLYALCEYPDVFGGAACISTHWPLSDPQDVPALDHLNLARFFRFYLMKHLPSPEGHILYFDYGTATLDSFYKPHQMLVDTIVFQKGYTSENWVTKEYPGEEHNESAWAKRLHIPLEFLLRRG
jgi:enterochelin esterase-like enzyme